MPQSELMSETYIDYFQRLKKITTYAELIRQAWVLGQDEGYLISISSCHLNSRPTIELLAKWRAKNQDAYPTQFPVTYEGTQKWLSAQLVHNPQRILFFVLTKEGFPIGHLGYNGMIWGEKRELEIDNVVRGEKNVQPGLMSLALQTLLKQTVNFWQPDRIFLRVFRDNHHAIQFYERSGFIFKEAIPLKKEIAGEVIRFIPIGNSEAPDRIFDLMEWTGK